MRAAIATVLLAGAVQLPPAPTPRDPAARDTATRSATGIIRGRVTDRENGQSLARVMVILVPGSLGEDQQQERRVSAPIEPRMTLTDADGRFEYRQVQSGTYVVTFDASQLRGTHLRQTFGESGPENEFRTSRPRPFVLRDGEVRSDVNVSLSRGLAIEGRVLDESGEPIANVEVSAQPWDAPSRVSMGRPRLTDDRGTFRLFGLKPGEYRVCAKVNLHYGPVDVRERLVPTCYPAATADGGAEPVTLASSDVVGIDIAVQRNRAYKVTGMAIDSTGAPIERPQVGLVNLGAPNASVDVRILSGGHFVAPGVTPGEYMLNVESGSRFNPGEKREYEAGFLPIRVDSTDVDGVVVATAKPTKVAGRIVFEEGLAEKLTNPIRVTTSADKTGLLGRMFGRWQNPAEVRPDLTFELTDLFGPQIVSVSGQPRGWVVRSVKYRDEDVTDVAVEFKTNSDPRTLEIVLTRQSALVSGRVLDAAGKATQEAVVVLLAADPSKRRSIGRAVSMATLKAEGTFSLAPVRAGEYIIVALSGNAMMSLAFEDPEKLERAASLGDRIVLVENEKREIDLRVVKPH